MKLSGMIAKLTALQAEHGDVEVMLSDSEGGGDCPKWEVMGAEVEVAEEGEYPEEYDMPAGFKFVHIFN